MDLKLSTTTAVIEKVKSIGRNATFGGRKKLFKEAGLEDRLGTYVGSTSQNLALIQALDDTEFTKSIG